LRRTGASVILCRWEHAWANAHRRRRARRAAAGRRGQRVRLARPAGLRRPDWLLMGVWALMALLMAAHVDVSHDLPLAAVALAGGAFIEDLGHPVRAVDLLHPPEAAAVHPARLAARRPGHRPAGPRGDLGRRPPRRDRPRPGRATLALGLVVGHGRLRGAAGRVDAARLGPSVDVGRPPGRSGGAGHGARPPARRVPVRGRGRTRLPAGTLGYDPGVLDLMVGRHSPAHVGAWPTASPRSRSCGSRACCARVATADRAGSPTERQPASG